MATYGPLVSAERRFWELVAAGVTPSTVLREIARGGGGRGSTGRYRRWYRFGADRGGWDATVIYRAHIAQARSEQRARPPKMGKIGRCEASRVRCTPHFV